jgi:hypothetical protein
MIRKFFFLIAFLLAGCTNSQPVEQENRNLSTNSFPEEFTIKIPSNFQGPLVRQDGSSAYWNYDDRTAHRKPEDILIEFYKMPISCLPSITGASNTLSLQNTGGRTVWGRVNAWDYMDLEGWESPYDLSNVVCQKDFLHTHSLCSEKNGKTVVICINQISDNPKQAEEIFSTFKWNN